MDAIQTFATKGDQLLFHFAFIPNEVTRLRASRLSQTMVAQAHENASYVLVEGEKNDDGRVKTVDDNYSLSGKESLPHVTLMHFWATPEQAAEALKYFSAIEQRKNLPTEVVTGGLSMFPRTPRFLSKSYDYDAVSWIDVERNKSLDNTQYYFQMAVDFAGGTPVTKLGVDNAWTPHLTLSVAPAESKETGARHVTLDQCLEKGIKVPSGSKTGSLALGLSGPNGQFRCVFGYAGQLEAIAPKLPSMVRRIRQAAAMNAH